MYVYIDESGNSGVNISDSAQPFFMHFHYNQKLTLKKE